MPDSGGHRGALVRLVLLVVDDASRDATAERARGGCGDPRVEVIVHERNGGVGAAIVTGYKRALEERHRRRRA